MDRATKSQPTKKSDSTIQRSMLAVGILLFALGALLPLFAIPHHWFGALRWTGLIVIGLANPNRGSLTGWIFFSMLLGGEIGLDQPQFGQHLRILGDIFLRLIKVIVAPLIFGTLVTGIAGHANLRSVGRMGLKSLIYFEVITTLALFIGLAAINLSRAGEGIAFPQVVPSAALPSSPAPHWDDFLLHVFPENIAKSVAENQILQVAVFSYLFGLALLRVPEVKPAPILRLCESLTETMFSFTNLVMYFAPIGLAEQWLTPSDTWALASWCLWDVCYSPGMAH